MVCKILQDLISSNKTVHTVSHEDAYYVKLIGRNPDEEFDGTYNWYYSGGCLDKLEVDGQVLLLTTEGKKKDQLCVLPLEMKNNWQASLSGGSSVQSTCGHTIHQVRGMYRQDEGFVGVRLRNACHLYSLNPGLHLESMHKATSKRPFIGLDLSPHSPGTYCTVTTSRCIQEWDINARKPVTSSVPTEQTLGDKWCSVSYCNDPQVIRVTDRCCSFILDKRNHTRKSSVMLCIKKMPNVLEYCETISLEFLSRILPHALYLCTNHHVFLYDIRAGSKPLQRWTHLLCSTPLYGCTVVPSSEEELVCIGNQEPGEIVTLLNRCDGEVPYCQVPPFALPNMHDAVHSAHKHGLWLNPFTQRRVQLSLTGLVWLPPHGSHLTLLSQTAAGDIFSHILKPRDLLQSNGRNKCNNADQKNNVNSSSETVNDYSKTRDLRRLVKWEKQLLKRKTSPTMKITTRKEMKHIYERLHSCGYRLHKNTEKKIQKDKWMMSKQAMQSCIDILAPRILAVWDIEKEPEWYEGEIVFQKDLSPTSHDKVQAWLTSVQNGEQNTESHNRVSEEEPSVFNTLHLSEQDIRSMKSEAGLTTLQSRKQSHTQRKDLYKMTHHGYQDMFTPSKTKFSTSTPSVVRHVEGLTQDTFKTLDHQVNDLISQDISLSQPGVTHDILTSVRHTIKESRELSQHEESMILSQGNSKINRKDIKIHSKNASVAGF
ncbi:hypothetical protein B7P43_G08000 [Cryptotermes secundus]|nr:uncharacterized protein LOC111873881 isoform X2 [Cryptotermes secundus]XP_033611156.1 uncharacterized protein LOC111873881 isoform X2 [Cryptotermes secundus]PNF15884.1 hypothetical protein B7P43_G08000 [Cryptotermes secundus]